MAFFKNTTTKKDNKNQKPEKATNNNKNLKKEAKKFKIPKTVQDSIPYYAVYQDEGIIETEPGVFTKSYLLEDINYQIAKYEEKTKMFEKYGQFLSSFDENLKIQITINNKNVNKIDFEKSTLLEIQQDNLDPLRLEYNDMLKKKISEGKNNLTREKYLTVSLKATSYENAVIQFARLDGEIVSNIKKISGISGTSGSAAIPLSTEERLEVLHDIYNIGLEGTFSNKINIDGEEKSSFSFENMRRLGLTSKDCIGPESFEFKKDYMMIGDKYARSLYLCGFPPSLRDDILDELTSSNLNMLTTINLESVPQDKALKIIKYQIVNINSNMIDRQKKASKAGYSVELVSPELKHAQEEAEELMDSLMNKNQKMFLMTLVIVHFADDLTELNKGTEMLQSTARKFGCTIKKLNYQQEQGLASSLPLAKNLIFAKRTLTTESTAVFMPFSSQELQHRNGMYYGLNAVSRNLIIFNRKNSKNGNGFILGTPGSGKSFAAKREMLNVLLNTNDDVVVIDPDREYGPMAELLNGEVVKIATGSQHHINPLDMEAKYGIDEDPIKAKSEFLLSICETVLGGRYGLTPTQRSIIDRCCRKAYRNYSATYNPETESYDMSKVPTLLDFKNILDEQNEREAREISVALEIYTEGSLDIFAHKTNVKTNSRFVVYDIKDLGDSVLTLGMLVVLDSIWNRIVQNRDNGRHTWFYIDEIYLLFANETSAQFLKKLYKRARKYGGIPTGITQNVEDLLKSDIASSMISNCEFIMMLNQAPLDREILAQLLNISETQLSFITNSNQGEGLIYTGSSMIPFIDKFPRTGKLYAAMTTKVDETKKK